jgi:hypothetical protein
MRYSRRHLQILLRRAIPLGILLWANLDIETIGVESDSGELIDHDTAIDTTRQQHCNPLIF